MPQIISTEAGAAPHDVQRYYTRALQRALLHGATCQSDVAVTSQCSAQIAGADGAVKRWQVKDGVISEKRLEKTLRLESPYGGGEKPPAVRALCVSPLDRDIMIGTAACDIWEVHDARQVSLPLHALHPSTSTSKRSTSYHKQVHVCMLDARLHEQNHCCVDCVDCSTNHACMQSDRPLGTRV